MAGVASTSRAVADYLRKYPLAPRYRREERAWITTVDRVRLAVARLPGPSDAPFTVVLLHGFLNSSRSPRVHAFARLLASEVHVVVPDLRGHGASGGFTTLGLREPLDAAAAVGFARTAFPGVPVVTVGTSLGAAAALLHAGAHQGVAGVVAVSSPAWWVADDREGGRRLAALVNDRWARLLAARLLRTRIGPFGGGVTDAERLVGMVSPAFTIIVHDPHDHYFGPVHAERLYAWAREPKALWWYQNGGHGIDLLTPAFAAELLAELRRRVGAAALADRPRVPRPLDVPTR